jgi:hypothetical protein
MALYSASFRAATCSDTLPMAGLRSGAATNFPIIREIKVFTELANAAIIRIVRITTAGTGIGIVENNMTPTTTAPTANAVHSYTSTAPTIQTGDVDVGLVGAAIGSGFHFTYYGEGKGLWVDAAASDAKGIAMVESAATANTYSGTIIWEE